jgi:hypothetical protein
MFSETYTANLRGAYTTLAIAAGVILLLTLIFAWRLRRSRRGLPRSSALALAFIALSAGVRLLVAVLRHVLPDARDRAGNRPGPAPARA